MRYLRVTDAGQIIARIAQDFSVSQTGLAAEPPSNLDNGHDSHHDVFRLRLGPVGLRFLRCRRPLRNDITVSFSDLDISRPAGAQILLQRIQTAARSVCGGSSDLRELAAYRLAQTCMKDTVEKGHCGNSHSHGAVTTGGQALWRPAALCR